MNPNDVRIGTVVGDMDNWNVPGYLNSLVEGYEVTSLIKWEVDAWEARDFQSCMMNRINRRTDGLLKYTNKLITVMDERIDGSFVCFWTYDLVTAGVLRLSPKKEEANGDGGESAV
jgi:hypothetical protein